jgi:hypothetical protein
VNSSTPCKSSTTMREHTHCLLSSEGYECTLCADLSQQGHFDEAVNVLRAQTLKAMHVLREQT